jgi:hypothetical protein
MLYSTTEAKMFAEIVRKILFGNRLMVPPEVIREMPPKLKRLVYASCRSGALIFYSSRADKEKIRKQSELSEIPPLPLEMRDTVTVSYGVLASRVYDVQSGACLAVS